MSRDGAPAGWYDDGSAGLRYWNGAAWTDQVAPATAQRPGATSRGVPGAIGLCALGAAVLGLVGVCLPWMGPELAGILLIIAAFVLSGVSLSREAAKWPGYAALGVSLIATIVGVVMFIIGFMDGYASTAG